MLRTFRIGLVAILLTCLLAAAEQASAAIMRWEFAGVINGLHDPADFFEGNLQVGDPFTGYYVFDSNTPDSQINDPARGEYISEYASMSATFGGKTFSDSGISCAISVINGNRDHFYLRAIDVLFNGSYSGSLSISLYDDEATVFNSDNLPTGPVDLLAFEERTFGMLGGLPPYNDVKVFGTVTSMILVPEPGSILLLSIGAFLAAGRNHMRPQVMKMFVCRHA